MVLSKTERFKRLRQMPCCCGCGRPAPSDVAHSNFSEHGKGMGIKADDMMTICLHRVCHMALDQYRMDMSRDEALEWFNEKLKYVNGVLDADNTSVL